MRRLIVSILLACCVGACGESTVITPNEVAQNYVSAIAEGNFVGACAMIEPHARAHLLAATKTRISCPALFARCLPVSLAASGDQSQLFYANVLLATSGDRAQATLSRTPAADAARRVSMLDTRKGWVLTTPGHAVTRCIAKLRHHRRKPRRSTHG